MPPSDKWAQYEAPAPAAGPDKWSQYEATPASPPAPALDLSLTPGKGTYRMSNSQIPGGWDTSKEVPVSYDKVDAAQTAGYKLHPDEISRYQKDSTHSTGPTWWEQAKSALMSSTEPTPDVALHPYDPTHPIKSVLDRAGDRAQNLYQAPINFIKAVDRGVYAGLPQLPAQLWDTVQKIYKGDPQGAEQLNQFTPPGMATSLLDQYQSDSQQYGPGTAQTNFLGNLATLYAAGKIGEGVAKQVPANAADWRVLGRQVSKRTVEPIARVMTGTGKGPVRELVEKRVAENEQIDAVNRDRLARQQKDQADADAAHRANLLKMKQKYEQDVRDATEKAKNGTVDDRAQYWAKRQADKQKYDQAVTEANKRHADSVTSAQKIQEGNQAAENTLALRRQHEQVYQQATSEHYAAESAADTHAKAEENTAWSAWRQKTAGKTLDGGQITGPLGKLRLDSPEVDRTLNQLEPRGDEVPQESPYAQLRARVSQEHFGKDYEGLSPVKQDEIDDLLHSDGHSPEPIAFDPQAGQPITIDRVQRASSILQRYIRSGRFEGPLLGEMKQVAKVLRNAVTRASADAGAAPELESARTATITYQDAFGKERRVPATARTIREKQINPEAFKERADEERLAKARRYDPTLVDSYRKVKAAREALKKLPAEDQLRKGLKQVPPIEKANRPLPPVLQEFPSPRAANLPLPSIVPPAENVPLELKPFRTISTGDIHGALKAAADASAGKWWHRGQWAAAVPIIQAMKGFWGGTIPPLATIGLESAGVLATTQLVNHFLRYPPMVEFLTQARPENVAQIPPELRGDLSNIIPYAQKQGIKVSPALLAAFSGAGQQQDRPPIPPAQAMQAVLSGAGGTQ